MSKCKEFFDEQGKAIVGLLAMALVISIVLMSLDNDDEAFAARAALEEKEVMDRIKPLGVVATTLKEAKEASPVVEVVVAKVVEPMTAEQVYNRACMACHTTGAAGAPKLGDAEAWAPRIAQGGDVLFEHATKGFKAMPPRGGSPQLSDDDITAAIGYMVEKSQ